VILFSYPGGREGEKRRRLIEFNMFGVLSESATGNRKKIDSSIPHNPLLVGGKKRKRGRKYSCRYAFEIYERGGRGRGEKPHNWPLYCFHHLVLGG